MSVLAAISTLMSVSCSNRSVADGETDDAAAIAQLPEEEEAVVSESAVPVVLLDSLGKDGVRYVSVKPVNVCSEQINLAVKDEVVVKAEFVGGCPGNTQGVARLVAGKKVNEVVELLDGIDCGGRGTSCPDQLAKALKQAFSVIKE